MNRLALSYGLAPTVVTAALLLQRAPVLPGDAWLRAAAIGGLASLLAAALVARRRPAWTAPMLLVGAALAVWSWAGLQAHARLAERLPARLEGAVLHVRGVVDALPAATPHGLRFGFATESCRPSEGEPPCALPSRLSLGWSGGFLPERRVPVPALRPGQRWELEVRLKRPHATNNPEAFDRELRWLQEGVGAVGSVRGGRLLDEHVGGLVVAFERERASIRDAMFDATGAGRERETGVLTALAVGDQAAIDPRLWVVFNQTGVGHLMSI